MYKETVTYTDFNGIERTEDLYFNLSETELINWNKETKGGMSQMIDDMINAKDEEGLTTLFQDLIDRSYGTKSDDGRRFIKTKEALEEFHQTEAYNKLFMMYIQDEEKASTFVNSVIPNTLLEENPTLPQDHKQANNIKTVGDDVNA